MEHSPCSSVAYRIIFSLPCGFSCFRWYPFGTLSYTVTSDISYIPLLYCSIYPINVSSPRSYWKPFEGRDWDLYFLSVSFLWSRHFYLQIRKKPTKTGLHHQGILLIHSTEGPQVGLTSSKSWFKTTMSPRSLCLSFPHVSLFLKDEFYSGPKYLPVASRTSCFLS